MRLEAEQGSEHGPWLNRGQQRSAGEKRWGCSTSQPPQTKAISVLLVCVHETGPHSPSWLDLISPYSTAFPGEAAAALAMGLSLPLASTDRFSSTSLSIRVLAFLPVCFLVALGYFFTKIWGRFIPFFFYLTKWRKNLSIFISHKKPCRLSFDISWVDVHSRYFLCVSEY